MSLRTWGDVEQNVRLLGLCIPLFFRSGARAAVAVFLQQLSYVLQAAVQFLLRKKFSELKFRGIYDLICGWPRGGSLNFDASHKEIGRGDELKLDALADRTNLRLDIGETTRTVEHADALPNLIRSEERRVGKECRSRWSADH